MTKKDYVILARAVKEAKNKKEVIENLCKELAKDNDRFNTDRFKEACK